MLLRTMALLIAGIVLVWLAFRIVFFRGFVGSDDLGHMRFAYFWDRFPKNHWETRLVYNVLLRLSLGLFGYNEIAAAVPTLLGVAHGSGRRAARFPAGKCLPAAADHRRLAGCEPAGKRRLHDAQRKTFGERILFPGGRRIAVLWSLVQKAAQARYGTLGRRIAGARRHDAPEFACFASALRFWLSPWSGFDRGPMRSWRESASSSCSA